LNSSSHYGFTISNGITYENCGLFFA